MDEEFKVKVGQVWQTGVLSGSPTFLIAIRMDSTFTYFKHVSDNSSTPRLIRIRTTRLTPTSRLFKLIRDI
jgi:hypothetical protein